MIALIHLEWSFYKVHIIFSSLKDEDAEEHRAMLMNDSKNRHANLKSFRSQTSSRRSRNALDKVSKMKKAYGSMARSETLTTEEQDWNSLNLTDDQTSTVRHAHQHNHHSHSNNHNHGHGNGLHFKGHNDSFRVAEELNDEFEDEVSNLYMWTQNLSVNDDYVNTPRLPTA